MVQIKINPVFKKVKVAKIDYKSVVVQFLCFKSQGYSPTMTVQARASSAVERLTVRERDIPVRLGTGNHEGA
jgi:uncharacterized membrane protein